MKLIKFITAKKNLYKLIDYVNNDSNPVTIITNNGCNAVLLSEIYYKAMKETLYLYSVPGLAKSILEADKQSPNRMSKYNSLEKW